MLCFYLTVQLLLGDHMSILHLNFEQINLIGEVKDFSVIGFVQKNRGDSLNSTLVNFKIEINFKKLFPSSILIQNFDNCWFTSLSSTIRDVSISFETFCKLSEKQNTSQGIQVNLLEIDSDKKFFNILLALSEKSPFKVAYNSLCIEYKKVIYIIYDTDENYRNKFNNLIEKDLDRTFYQSLKIKKQLEFFKSKALLHIFTHPSFILLEDGSISYLDVVYSHYKQLLNSPKFIKEYYLSVI